MKFCLVLVGRIGDLILSTPAFSAIKRQYENAEISCIISRGNGAVLRNNPFIDEVVEFSNTFSGYFRILKFLLNNKFDYWIDPKDHYSTTSHYLGLIAKAVDKIGFEKPKARHRFVFNHVLHDLSDDISLHFVGVLAIALRCADVQINHISDYFSQLYPDSASIKKAKEYYSSLLPGKINLLINLSATSESRIYSLKNWSEFFGYLNFEKYNVTLISMPREADIAKSLSRTFPQIRIHDSSALEDYFALIHECGIIITPDTSAVHAAAAFTKPAIALYTYDERNMSRFAPLARNLNKTFIVLAPQEDSTDIHSVNSIAPLNIHRHLETISAAIK